MNKTNAIRILDKNKINYKIHTYNGVVSGIDVCNYLNENPNKVFKTLVTIGKSKKYYVFLVPVSSELNLKKAAAVVNEKNIQMIKSKDLLDITGYIHGGCSPIGMKKNYPVIIDKSVIDTIYISGGLIGIQIEISLEELSKVIKFRLEDIKNE